MMRAKKLRNLLSPVRDLDYGDFCQQALIPQSLTGVEAPLRRQIGINYMSLSPDNSKFLISTTDSK